MVEKRKGGKEERLPGGRLVTPLSHKVQTQNRANRRSPPRHALCVQVARALNDAYLRVSHVGSMREAICRQVRRSAFANPPCSPFAARDNGCRARDNV